MLLFYLQMLDTPEDKHKFELVYEEYRNYMFHVANKILRNREDSEDAVHQAFISIAEHIDKIGDPISNLTKGYVLTIVEHKAIDIIRSNKRNSYIPLDETFIDAPTMTQAIEYCGEDSLSKCILKLPANYREIIMLKYVQGYSSREIAGMLNITEANAIKLDQRAKKKLRELYAEEDKYDN